VLATIVDPMDEELNGGDDYNEKGCAFCGGLGHRVATCPKLEQARLPTPPHISPYLRISPQARAAAWDARPSSPSP